MSSVVPMSETLRGPQYPMPMNGGRCSNAFNTGIMRISIQCGTLIVLSHILHKLIFHRIGQPPVISQIFTGLLIGPTILGKVRIWHSFLIGTSNTRIMGSLVIISRMFFMLLVGLEMDIPFLRRSLRRASIITLGAASVCFAAAAASSPIIYRATAPNGHPILFLLILALVYTNTASPIVIRMCAELKLASSDVGRLAISSSLLNDMACLLILAVATTNRSGSNSRTKLQKVMSGVLALLLLAAASAVLRPIVRWVNRRNEGRRHVGNVEIMGLLCFTLLVAALMEVMGYNSTMSCFMLGLVMPREGGTLRTMVDKLSYPISNFVLPIFFGDVGVNMDVMTIQGNMVGAVVLMVVLNIGSKVLGTIAATTYLGLPLYEGIVLGFLLNMKGHVDVVLVSIARASKIWGEEAQKVLLVTVLMTTLTAGPAGALVVRLERRALRYRGATLQSQPPGTELRLLACVHGSRDVPTMLNLIDFCSGGPPESPLAAYLMHLVQLTAKAASYMLYHQHDAEEKSGWEHGGDDARIVTATADVFCIDTGIELRQVTVVSAMETMQDDVYNATVDVRASIVIVPFHKHQRVDGRMQVGRKGVQQFNERLMKRIPCTVGVLVDRGLEGGDTPTTDSPSNPLHQIAVLFFGGADDREALALGMRLSLHPHVALTLVHFMPESNDEYWSGDTSNDGEAVPAISDHRREMEADEIFIMTFMRRSITAGRAAYTEIYVKDAAETVAAMCAMNNKYALFLVGRGRERVSPLTKGMNDWEECPELGSVGDLLASSDFMGTSSVLVIRRYDNPRYQDGSDNHCEFSLTSDDEDDEFSVI